MTWKPLAKNQDFLNSKTLEFEEFFDDHIPKYAILSHTWKKNEEVSHLEMLSPSSKTREKSGYRKVIQTAKLARRDDLHFFWVDTCAIDKNNSSELTEAINCRLFWKFIV